MDESERIEKLSDRKQNGIVKSVALNNAVAITASMIQNGADLEDVKIEGFVIGIAREFEKYLRE